MGQNAKKRTPDWLLLLLRMMSLEQRTSPAAGRHTRPGPLPPPPRPHPPAATPGTVPRRWRPARWAGPGGTNASATGAAAGRTGHRPPSPTGERSFRRRPRNRFRRLLRLLPAHHPRYQRLTPVGPGCGRGRIERGDGWISTGCLPCGRKWRPTDRELVARVTCAWGDRAGSVGLGSRRSRFRCREHWSWIFGKSWTAEQIFTTAETNVLHWVVKWEYNR